MAWLRDVVAAVAVFSLIGTEIALIIELRQLRKEMKDLRGHVSVWVGGNALIQLLLQGAAYLDRRANRSDNSGPGDT